MINQKNDPNLLYLPKSFENNLVSQTDDTEKVKIERVNDHISELEDKMNTIISDIDKTISEIDKTVIDITKDLNQKSDIIDNYNILYASEITEDMSKNKIHPEVQQVFENEDVGKELFRNNKFLNTVLFERLQSDDAKNVIFYSDEWKNIKNHTNSVISNENSYDSIIIHIDPRENIKVLDFVLNYKQKPVSDENIVETNILEIHKYLEGRFYIIRDTNNNSLVVKSVIKNSDNELYTKEYNIYDNEIKTFKTTNGPEFHMEFIIVGNSLNIIFKDFTPYEWCISRNTIENSDEILNTENYSNIFDELQYDNCTDYINNELKNIKMSIECDFFITDKIGHIYNTIDLISKQFVTQTGYDGYITDNSILKQNYTLLMNKKGLLSYDLPVISNNNSEKHNEIISYTFTNYKKLEDGTYSKITSIEDIRQQLYNVLFDYYQDYDIDIEKIIYGKKLENLNDFKLVNDEPLYNKELKYCYCNVIDTSRGMLTYVGEEGFKTISSLTGSIGSYPKPINIPLPTRSGNTASIKQLNYLSHFFESGGVQPVIFSLHVFGLEGNASYFAGIYSYDSTSITEIQTGASVKKVYEFNDMIFGISHTKHEKTAINYAGKLDTELNCVDQNVIYKFNVDTKLFEPVPLNGVNKNIFTYKEQERNCFTINNQLYFTADSYIFKYNTVENRFDMILDVNTITPDVGYSEYNDSEHLNPIDLTQFSYKINDLYQRGPGDTVIMTLMSFLTTNFSITGMHFTNVYIFDPDNETIIPVDLSENLYNVNYYNSTCIPGRIQFHEDYGILLLKYRHPMVGSVYWRISYTKKLYENGLPLFSEEENASILKYDEETNQLDFFSNLYHDSNIGLNYFNEYGTYTTDVLNKDILKIHDNKMYNKIYTKTLNTKEEDSINECLSVTKTNINDVFLNFETSAEMLENNFNNYSMVYTGYGIYVFQNENTWYLESPYRRLSNGLRVLPSNDTVNITPIINEVELSIPQQVVFMCESNYGLMKGLVSDIWNITDTDYSKEITIQCINNNELCLPYNDAKLTNTVIPFTYPKEVTILNIKPTSHGTFYSTYYYLRKINSNEQRYDNIITLELDIDYPFYKYIEDHNGSIYCINVNTIFKVPENRINTDEYEIVNNPITFIENNVTSYLTTICATSKGLFLGTGSGLYKYDDESQLFKFYGLGGNVIFAIKENPETKDVMITSGDYDLNITDRYIRNMNYSLIPYDQEYIYNLKKTYNYLTELDNWWIQDTIERCDREISFYKGQFIITVEENTNSTLVGDPSALTNTLWTLDNNTRILKHFCDIPVTIGLNGWANRVPNFVKETTNGLFGIFYRVDHVNWTFKQIVYKYDENTNVFEEFSDDLFSTYQQSSRTWYDTIIETSQGIFFLDSYNRGRIYYNNSMYMDPEFLPPISPSHYIQLNDTNFRNYQYSSVGITPPINWQKFKLKDNNLSNRFGNKAYISSNSYLNLTTLQSQKVFTDTKLITEEDSFDIYTMADQVNNVVSEIGDNFTIRGQSRYSNYLTHFMCTVDGVFALEVLDSISITPSDTDYIHNKSIPISLYFNSDPLNSDVFKKVNLHFSEDIPINWDSRVDMLFKVFKDKNILFSEEFVKGFYNTKNGLFYGKNTGFVSDNWDESSMISYPERNMCIWKFDKTSTSLKQYILPLPEVLHWKGYTVFFKDIFNETYIFIYFRTGGSVSKFNLAMYKYNVKNDVVQFVTLFANDYTSVAGMESVEGSRFQFVSDSVIGFENKIFVNFFRYDLPFVNLLQSYDIKTKETKIYPELENHIKSARPAQFFVFKNELYYSRFNITEMNRDNRYPIFSEYDYIYKYDSVNRKFIKINGGSSYMFYYNTEFGTLVFNNNNNTQEGITTDYYLNYYNKDDDITKTNYIEHLKHNFNIIDNEMNIEDIHTTSILNLYIKDPEYRYVDNYDIRYGFDSKGKPYLYIITYNDLFNDKIMKNNLSTSNTTPIDYNKYINSVSSIMKYDIETKTFIRVNSTSWDNTYGLGNTLEFTEYNPFNRFYDNMCTENFYVFDDIELWINSTSYPYHAIQFRKPYTISKEYSNEHRFNGFYNLTLTGINQEDYNNLDSIDTTFSNIDKLVISENGSINLLRTKDDDYSQNYIKQYYEFKNYYPHTKNLLLSENEQNDVSTFIHKEDYNINSIKSYIKNISFGHTRKTLSNRRFFKPDTILKNGLSHKTNMILGDLENIIKDNIVFKIDLEIYPFNLKTHDNGYENRYKWFTDGYHPDKFFDWSHKK